VCVDIALCPTGTPLQKHTPWLTSVEDLRETCRRICKASGDLKACRRLSATSKDLRKTFRRTSGDLPETIGRPPGDLLETCLRPAGAWGDILETWQETFPRVRKPPGDHPKTLQRPSQDLPESFLRPSGGSPETGSKVARYIAVRCELVLTYVSTRIDCCSVVYRWGITLG
jgi:hypothetical protein